MIFNSFQFIWLFPLIFAIYYAFSLLPVLDANQKLRGRNILLILISYGLYMQWNATYALILLGITAVTYGAARWIEARRAWGKRRYIMISALLCLLPLVVFKYFNFLGESISAALQQLGLAGEIPGLNWAIPIGISFFSFQAVGYLWDVYYRRIEAEKNWWDYMLFISFFPQILAGPISKAKDLLPQIKQRSDFNYPLAVEGLRFLLWGMFMKVVVADRLGLYADVVFNNYPFYSGSACLIAVTAYTFQIYCDFAGYSLMAIGVGRIMGFTLVNNFRRPYLAFSITDFWHRWHISLSTWLRDYIYIPLGGSRCSKSRNYLNILVTFLVSGIWHGANWTFVLWGALHGIFQIAEKMLGLNRMDDSCKAGIRILRMLSTFLLVSFAWVFFRAPSVGDAWNMLARIFTGSDGLFLNPHEMTCIFLGVLLLSELIKEYAPQLNPSRSRFAALRWAVGIFIMMAILLNGVFDSSQFIYANF